MIDDILLAKTHVPSTDSIPTDRTSDVAGGVSNSCISNTPASTVIMSHSILQTSPRPSEPSYKKYIVYLEPLRSSPFYQSILDFFAVSMQTYGRNEAHMYHPHTSLTGFFDMPIISNVEFDNLIITALDHAITQLPSQRTAPAIQHIHRPPHQQDTLSIRLSVPTEYRSIISHLKQTMDDFLRRNYAEEYHPAYRVRQKPMDHISLAYCRNIILQTGDTRLPGALLSEIQGLAERTIKLTQTPPDWFIVLYEADRSEDINISHKFRELKRWKVA